MFPNKRDVCTETVGFKETLEFKKQLSSSLNYNLVAQSKTNRPVYVLVFINNCENGEVDYFAILINLAVEFNSNPLAFHVHNEIPIT